MIKTEYFLIIAKIKINCTDFRYVMRDTLRTYLFYSFVKYFIQIYNLINIFLEKTTKYVEEIKLVDRVIFFIKLFDYTSYTFQSINKTDVPIYNNFIIY